MWPDHAVALPQSRFTYLSRKPGDKGRREWRMSSWFHPACKSWVWSMCLGLEMLGNDPTFQS